MPAVPIRGVGEMGLITDQRPQDLPLTAWTKAQNVRFRDGLVSSYSVLKHLDPDYIPSGTPIGVVDAGSGEVDGYIMTVFDDGSMEQWYNGGISDPTPATTLATSERQMTHTQLGSVSYICRESDIPIYRNSVSDPSFETIPDWEPTDRCKSLRAFKDFLIAINVQKDGNEYSSMVKWSDAAQAGAPPQSWDVTDDATLAGETVLGDVRGYLIDGLSLGDSFIIYGNNQTYRMDHIEGPFVFSFHKVFEDQGVISKNCAVSIDGRHYVFGTSDIFVHDGMIKKSISVGKIRDQIYDEMDYEKRHDCFVFHDEVNNEVIFAYPSVSDDCAWSLNDITGCNRGAVYSYISNTWTIIDLPAVVAATHAATALTEDWTKDGNWNEEAVSWNSFAGQAPKTLLVASAGNPALGVSPRLYFYDNLHKGRILTPVATDVIFEGVLEATHKDLDEMGAELYGRKMCRRLVPQFKTPDPDDSVYLKVGQNALFTDDVKWGPEKEFKPWSTHKYDMRTNGRYLAIGLRIPKGVFAEFHGYDADILQISGR